MIWDKPKLSIVIPVFNTKEYLDECLESVQTAISGISAEIFLVDDGSTDGSLELIKGYANEDKRITLLSSAGKGPGAARNMGAAKAKGEYIAFVDSDDYVADSIYKDMLKVAEQDKSDMVVCDVIREDGKKYIHSELHRKAFHNLRNRVIDINRDYNLVFDGTSVNRLIKKSFYVANQISFPEGVYYEDVSTVQRMYCLAEKVSFLRKWGYCWRLRKNSISQQQFSRKNLDDRVTMLIRLKEIAKKDNPEKEYQRIIDYKILTLEFNGCISILKDLPRETAAEYVETIATFFENNVDLREMDNLSLYDKQKVRNILNRDVDGLIRLLNYKIVNYMNAPVVEIEDGYQMRLHDDIFDSPFGGMDNEFNNMPYWMSIDSAEHKEDSLVIHTHVYIRRINMPDYESQDVKVFLVNDLSGAEIELPVTKELRPSLTKARGTVLNYDDYREYHYNYDGTGFSFEIKPDDFADRKEFSGRNFILLECTNKLGHKNQVLRFGTKAALKTINNTELSTEKYKVDFSTDEIQVLWVNVI